MQIFKTKKGKIQISIIIFFSLVFIISSVLLIIFNSKECNYNNVYSFEYSDSSNYLSTQITLKDDNTYDFAVFDNGSFDRATGDFYILNGFLFLKPDLSSTYNCFGKISYNTIIRESNDPEVIDFVFECENSFVKTKTCNILLVTSLVLILSILIWIMVENYIKNKKEINKLDEKTN